MRRRGARRAVRRTARRTTRRVARRAIRRTIVVGGMVMLVAGGTAAAIKMSQKDAQRVEQHTGYPPDQLSEEELTQAMRDLGIQSIELTDEDKAVIAKQSGETPTSAAATTQAAPAGAAGDDSYIAELEQLADLRDRGIITSEEFEAKKKKLLGL